MSCSRNDDRRIDGRQRLIDRSDPSPLLNPSPSPELS